MPSGRNAFPKSSLYDSIKKSEVKMERWEQVLAKFARVRNWFLPDPREYFISSVTEGSGRRLVLTAEQRKPCKTILLTFFGNITVSSLSLLFYIWSCRGATCGPGALIGWFTVEGSAWVLKEQHQLPQKVHKLTFFLSTTHRAHLKSRSQMFLGNQSNWLWI